MDDFITEHLKKIQLKPNPPEWFKKHARISGAPDECAENLRCAKKQVRKEITEGEKGAHNDNHDGLDQQVQTGEGGKSIIQSVIFRRTKFTADQARAWLKKQGLKPIKKVDKTKNYLRYRLQAPDDAREYRTKKISADVAFTLQF